MRQFLQKQDRKTKLPHDELTQSISTGNGQDEIPSSCKVTWLIFMWPLFISLTLIVVIMSIWLPHAGNGSHLLRTDAGGVIGGRLTQTQAKTIDLLCGGFITPIIMVALNYAWFSSARTYAVDGHTSKARGLPLSSLVSLSGTTGGSYDILTVRSILRGGTWRLSLLGILIILSALSKTAISNIIAYEAFQELRPRETKLRMLAATSVENVKTRGPYNTIDIDWMGFNNLQQSQMAANISSLLTGLSFSKATDKITVDGFYIGANVTAAAMSSVPPNILQLFKVPGYQMSVECTTEQPINFGIVALGGYTTSIMTSFSDIYANALYPGLPADIQGAYNDQYQFVSFSINTSYAYLGYLSSFNLSKSVMSSPYGDIRPTAINATSMGFGGTKSIMSFWGIRCSINRQEGVLNFTRESAGSSWVMKGSTFGANKTQVRSLLAQWQTTLNYRAPGAPIPGIGPAIAKSAKLATCKDSCDSGVDYTSLAHNYLYATAEVERIMFEVAANDADDLSSSDSADLFQIVSGSATEEFYRMTYVPVLLLVGFVSLLLSTLIPFGMSIYSIQARNNKLRHEVSPLRLIIECANALTDGVAEGYNGGLRVDEIGQLSDKELEKWACKYRVVYETVGEAQKLKLALVHVSG